MTAAIQKRGDIRPCEGSNYGNRPRRNYGSQCQTLHNSNHNLCDSDQSCISGVLSQGTSRESGSRREDSLSSLWASSRMVGDVYQRGDLSHGFRGHLLSVTPLSDAGVSQEVIALVLRMSLAPSNHLLHQTREWSRDFTLGLVKRSWRRSRFFPLK